MHRAHEVGAPAEGHGPRRPAHPPPHVLPKPGGPIGTPRLLLIKPGQACGKGVNGFGRQAQACWADMIAQPVKAFLNPSNEGLVGVFVQFQGGQDLVDHLDRSP